MSAVSVIAGVVLILFIAFSVFYGYRDGPDDWTFR